MIAATGITVALLMGTSIAYADSTPSPSPTASAESYQERMDRFKRERESFNQAMQERAFKMRAINAEFKSAVDKAAANAKVALVSATTPAQKSAIAATRQSAISAAIAARESAINALGPLPTPPLPPLREDRSSKDKKDKSKR